MHACMHVCVVCVCVICMVDGHGAFKGSLLVVTTITGPYFLPCFMYPLGIPLGCLSTDLGTSVCIDVVLYPSPT